MLLVIGFFTGWRRGGIISTFIAWLGSWLRDRGRSVEVIFDAYSFFVRHRYLRFENLNLSYTSKTLESLRKFKKNMKSKKISKTHTILEGKMFDEAFLVTEWTCVLNKLSFGPAAYSDFVCLRKDTFLQKIKNDYLAKKCVCVCVGWGG